MTGESVPDGWKLVRVSDLCRLQRGFDITEATRAPGTVPVYSSSGISYHHSTAAVRPPGLVTGRKGLLGRVFLVDEPFWPHDTTLWADNFNGNEPKFVACVLESFHLERLDAATSVPTLNRNNLAAYQVAIPVSRAEQERISSAVADADSAIRAVERLSAKMRDIKQGMMQELLTGRTRLPGFVDEWHQLTFGEIASPVSERVGPGTVGGRVIELEHLSSATGVLLGDEDVSSSLSLKTKFARGDVLFGKLRAYLRKYWLADRDGYCSTEIWALRPRPGVATGSFLRYVVEQESFIDATSTAYGTHMPRSDWGVVSKFELGLPSVDEQRAIAQLLTDSDAELAALAKRLEAALAIKTGMMQELLTGRTRLPLEAVS